MKDNKLVNTLMWKSGAKFEMMNWVDYENFSYEKFAELIIQECIDVVIESDPSPKMTFNEPYRSVVENIKEHFGVE